ncbi:hypothetical protein V6N12_041025 [Hibiscus sabdariffa]|uniref:Uncharacterized protein n=1 Tax=Hibiscus sabdariffa TaxID=183260 RepID=A0ABR2E7A4_9ROSI
MLSQNALYIEVPNLFITNVGRANRDASNCLDIFFLEKRSKKIFVLSKAQASAAKEVKKEKKSNPTPFLRKSPLFSSVQDGWSGISKTLTSSLAKKYQYRRR